MIESSKVEYGCRLADLGLVTALGSTPAENWTRLVNEDPVRICLRDDLIPGESLKFGSVSDELPPIPEHLQRYAGRNNQLALAAYETIADSARLAIAKYGAHRVGVVVGSSTACVAEAELAFRKRQPEGDLGADFALVQISYGGLSEFLQEISGAAGPCYALSTACSSGAKAIAAARRLLDLGICDAVISGAVDSLCKLTSNGFRALQALSKDVSNPMSVSRDGLNLGEGAALFLLLREPGGVQVLGAGESSDAHHISAPSPDGSGAYRAMEASLADSGLGVSEIAYLNLHGTGTPQNDAMESAAVHRLFGSRVPCSSTKPFVGHTLGASGAVEAAFCWLVLASRVGNELILPPHVFDGEYDSSMPELSLVSRGDRAKVSAVASVMSNSFGFGGSNCSLIFSAGAA